MVRQITFQEGIVIVTLVNKLELEHRVVGDLAANIISEVMQISIKALKEHVYQVMTIASQDKLFDTPLFPGIMPYHIAEACNYQGPTDQDTLTYLVNNWRERHPHVDQQIEDTIQIVLQQAGVFTPKKKKITQDNYDSLWNESKQTKTLH